MLLAVCNTAYHARIILYLRSIKDHAYIDAVGGDFLFT
jgi:hypothetical protein